ncbi:MAG: amidohydrolase family protein [Bacteriovoracaceae bacterium]|nr:amidohydrolase family protein [Bacteroidota bacterium]
MKTSVKYFFLTVFIFQYHLLFPSTPIPAKKQDHPIVLAGGTLHTVSGAVIENGMILFDKGKITFVGKTVDIPSGAERIDVSGKHIYPGLINAASNIGLNEIEAVRATIDISETGKINSNVRAEVAVNPESELIPTTRANGVTISHVMPGGSLIAGRTAAMMMDGWTTEEMTLKAPVGLYINWPTMRVSRSPFVRQSEEEQKKAIENALKELQNAFSDARAYLKAKKADGEKHPTDLRWETFAPLFDRRVSLIVGANELSQIQSAVQFARDQNVRMTIHGGRDAWKVAGLLKENNVSVIVEPIHDVPGRRWEEYDIPFTVPVKLFSAGVLFAISGGGNSTMNERNIGFQAATASAYGLPREEALKAVTINAAKVLGIESMVGSLEIGKDATLIVTTGDPLEIMSNVEMEFIQGRKIDLRSRHTELWKKYEEKYRQLGIAK